MNSGSPTNGRANGTPSARTTLEHPAQTERSKLVEALSSGELSLHKLPQELSAREAASIRREALEHAAGTETTKGLGHYSFDADVVSNRNCENLIGVAQVPMGAVGPVPVRGSYIDDDRYVPLATTEGALIASVNRGCATLRAAGGAIVHVEDVGMTRAPVFRTSGIRESTAFTNWVADHEEEIRTQVEATSRYLKLKDIRPFSLGSTVFLRFRFSTGDAMGMNMATLACNQVIEDLIVPETGVEFVSLSGNYCVDKKPSAVNVQEGRGKRIFAEVELSEDVLKRYLKTNADDLTEVQYRKNMLGSTAAGSMGMNAHYANMVAAFFVATGQDIAQVVEGALGTTCIEKRGEGGVYISIFHARCAPRRRRGRHHAADAVRRPLTHGRFARSRRAGCGCHAGRRTVGRNRTRRRTFTDGGAQLAPSGPRAQRTGAPHPAVPATATPHSNTAHSIAFLDAPYARNDRPRPG